MKTNPSLAQRCLFAACLGLLTLCLTGCLTKRTVKQGGRTVEKKYVVKRPVKNLINNTEFE